MTDQTSLRSTGEPDHHLRIDREWSPFYDVYDMATATYDRDARLSGYRAQVVASTCYQEPDGTTLEPLTTFLLRFPRFVLSEFNTHRVFSRNSASSRARSVSMTLLEVFDAPFVPLFTANQKGMSGRFIESEQDVQRATELWIAAARDAVRSALSLLTGKTYAGLSEDDLRSELSAYHAAYQAGATDGLLNVHKQVVNRLLEPFMWHEVVVTADEWENFYRLRTDEAADPHIRAVAVLMQAASQAVTPTFSAHHIPFAQGPDDVSDLEAVRTASVLSAAVAARVSYTDLAGGLEHQAQMLEPNRKLAKRLLTMGHMSPFEHVGYAPSLARELAGGVDGDYTGNFSTWAQQRKVLEVVD